LKSACLAFSSAYELGMSRRAMLTRAAAATPLAAVVGPAFADSCAEYARCAKYTPNGNEFLVKAGKRSGTEQITGAEALKEGGLGRQENAAIDANGAAAAVGGGARDSSIALGSTAAVAAEPIDAIKMNAAAKEKAMARLM